MMNQCLVKICKEFESIQNFLQEPNDIKEHSINKLFQNFLVCFSSLKEEKFDYPREFAKDIHLYNDGSEPIIKKFEDVQMRYLILSDFYDYVRLSKKYKKGE